MTNYKFEVKPGYPSSVGRDRIRMFVEENKPSWKDIKEIALRCGVPKKCEECGTVLDDFSGYLDNYTASGGGECRTIKETLQKARVIWWLEASIKHDMNIDIKFSSY